MSGYEDLAAAAKANAAGIPPHWGASVEVEVDGFWVGRFRGEDRDNRDNPIYLFWEDGTDEPVFFWHAYRLQQGMVNAKPEIGDRVCVFREENYKTKYDEDGGEPKGLAYGVASEACGDLLPAMPELETPDDDIPF